ncbi:Drought induced 19 protein-like [Macleaya cordata]|uniref:Drought induced 19 protein-like n=1 Tax=Macleaya cordata TaxID=56857 RepID=A0A200RD12_MACCD|nr:Drought induced 19 protein-like [Macleaya cordata]
MDVDLWASRVHSATHLTAMQTSRLHSENHLIMVGSDGDEDVQACFPCPFCYVEIEVPVLCTHLQEEHCFDVKNSVCPVCAENLGKDMIGHFTVQHSHMLKRRRKSQRSGQWTNSSAMLGKELRELSSFLGVNSTFKGNTLDSAPDPLLSPFLCSMSVPEPKVTEDTCSSITASTNSDVKSKESSTSDEAREQDYQEKSERAEFFQQLVLSMIF